MTCVANQYCVRWHLRLLICVSRGPLLSPSRLPSHCTSRPLKHTHLPLSRLDTSHPGWMIGSYACPTTPTLSCRHPFLRLVNAVYLVCSLSAVKGCRCQSSQIASAPPLSARMSTTVAESGDGNYQYGAAASPPAFPCVFVLSCIRLVAAAAARRPSVASQIRQKLP